MAVWSSGLSCQPGTKTLTPAGNFLGPHHGCRLLTQILADSPLPGETRVRLDAQIPVISLSPPGGLSGFSLISEALSLWGLALVMFVLLCWRNFSYEHTASCQCYQECYLFLAAVVRTSYGQTLTLRREEYSKRWARGW